MTLKPTLTEQQELDIRVARLRQVQVDLDEAIAAVDRHRKELERINREVAAITDAVERRK